MPCTPRTPRPHALRPAALRPLAIVLVLVLSLAACSGGDAPASDTGSDSHTSDTSDTASDSDTSDTASDSDTSDTASDSDTFGVDVEGEVGEAPEITLPGGEPPTGLVVVDLVEGDGEVVPAGATVTTGYAGVSWLNDGTQFDSSFDRGGPATFPLSRVIPGWTQGIPGMRVGGRRLLIIPPDLAYGPNPPSPDIAVDDTLVFVIDLAGIQ